MLFGWGSLTPKEPVYPAWLLPQWMSLSGVPECFPAPRAWPPNGQRTCWGARWSGGDKLATETGCGLGAGVGIARERVPCTFCLVPSAPSLPSATPSPRERSAKYDICASAPAGETHPKQCPRAVRGTWGDALGTPGLSQPAGTSRDRGLKYLLFGS